MTKASSYVESNWLVSAESISHMFVPSLRFLSTDFDHITK